VFDAVFDRRPPMAKRATTIEPTYEALVGELRGLIGSIEDVFSAAAGSSSEKLTELKGQAEANLLKAKATLGDMERRGARKARTIAADSDDYVHESPWTAISIAATIGLLLGVLIGRK
jgi:ElaB/YqjD/DUF883 family membrane-anchored ribosome-binding protein